MKICIASEGRGGMDDAVSMQFGRCPVYTIVDIDGEIVGDVKVIENPGAGVASGAGVQAAQRVVSEGCEAVIAGSIGPNSYQVLSTAGVEVYTAPRISVREAVERLIKGELLRQSPGRVPGMGPAGGGG
ncbi:MAG: dinitrogenase iron-molybdenum cofactor biosynthesis protein, partial [Thermoplasmata archaeon]